MARTVLERAKQAFYRRRYSDVITLLEPNVIQYRDSFQFYYFLGLACLHTGDSGGATSYFQRARQIRMRDPDLLAAQAALFLRRGDTHQAVEYYLEALEYAPEHRLSKRSLDFIRKKGDAETISSLVETGRISRFYPHPAKPLSPFLVVSVVAVLALGSAVVLAGRPLLSRMEPQTERADLAPISLTADERNVPVEMGGSYRYILTEAQVLKSYASAQRFFQDFRDNAAQVEINRILWSNAAAPIKQKARMLMEYLTEPGFDSIKDSYPYETVRADPWLYLDCWVVWKGMATNIRKTDRSVDFDFLVGYDTRNTLEGIVPVHLDSVLEIDSNRPLELLARIAADNGALSLAGSGIFQTRTPVPQRN
jgi:tetratricopeptide (TPR) repeat protein